MSSDPVYNTDNILNALEITESPRIKKLSNTIRVEASQWKECLQKISEACAVRWIIQSKNRINAQRDDASDNSERGTSTQRTRVKRLLYSEHMKCHRSGSYTSAASVRPVQKKGKGCNCKATLKIACFEEEMIDTRIKSSMTTG